MLTDEKNLLALVLADPDDVAARQVYADALVEQNDPRGELIHVQCRLAELPPDDPLRRPLEDRAAELLAAHEQEWSRPLHDMIGRPEDLVWRRGFVEDVGRHVPIDLLERLSAQIPLRAASFVLRSDEDAERLSATPQLARLRDLMIAAKQLRWILPLVRSPHLGPLTALALSIGDPREAPELWNALRDSPAAATLRALHVAGNELAFPSYAALPRLETLNVDLYRRAPGLCTAPLLHGVRALRVSTSLDGERLAELASHSGLHDLRSLSISVKEGCGAELAVAPWLSALEELEAPNELFSLLASASLQRVRSLSLHSSHGESFVEALAHAPLPELRALALTSFALTRAALEVLVAAPFASSLHTLRLSKVRYPTAPEELEPLYATDRLDAITHLELTSADLGAHGLRALLASPSRRLTSLVLRSCRLGKDAGRLLSEAATLSQLSTLDLSDTDLDESGVVALAASPHLARLEHLALAGTREQAALALAESPHLGRLKRLRLPLSHATDAGARALRKRFGLRVYFVDDINDERAPYPTPRPTLDVNAWTLE